MSTLIELLSPARNPECGKAAIIHGADAVYIGASCFGARADASNTVADIEQLVRFAHLYKAKVYVALNTILYDSEIDAAVQLIRQLYEAGIDALIIQDMGLLQCSLPPLPLFASTQTHNLTREKVSFLEKAGFSRVILARELSLPQIENIRRHTGIELECFVHGALCVSYSGQCYISQAITGRSGNRGVCAQPCRSSYKLLDANGVTLIENSHALSLKDLNLSEHLAALIEAGVTSLKIEGRLKDLNYVKNITAFYRRRLDAIMEKDGRWAKTSSGSVDLRFTPDPYKTFNRGYTAYFINGRKEKVASPQTQKSTGEYLGRVSRIDTAQRWFTVETKAVIRNGDGLCWMHPHSAGVETGRARSQHTLSLQGALVNRVDGGRIFPARPVQLDAGTKIFRNNDFLFEKILSGNSADRRIAVSLELGEHESGYMLRAEDEDGNQVEHAVNMRKLPAKDKVSARSRMDAQLRKLGNSVFSAKDIIIPVTFNFFIPKAALNEMRRQAIRQLEDVRIERCRAKPYQRPAAEIDFPETEIDYKGNAANQHAKDFYRLHGVKQIDDAFELQNDYHEKTVMIAKHCIKYQYNMCPVMQRASGKCEEPLYLKDNQHIYRLEFDCCACEMKVIFINNLKA